MTDEEKSITIMVIFIGLLFSKIGFAAPGWSGETTTTSLYSVNETQVLIKLSSFANPNACSVNYGGDVIVNPTTQKSLFSMLLSAYMANKTVNISVTSLCTTIWDETSYAVAAHARFL